jgi:hypothetical protein
MKERLLPLGIKNPVKTELPALIALEAIGQPWFNEGHLADLSAIGMVTQILAAAGSDAHQVATDLLALLATPELDVEEIRPRVVGISIWLNRQPNGRVDAAIRRLLKQECGVNA